MQVETIKIKADDGDYRIINLSDFDPKRDHPFDDEAKAQADKVGAEDEAAQKLAAERKAQANFGQIDGNVITADGAGKNPSGTFSEPTPTDIRYPDKDATEFENNHGAFVGASAAALRAQEGLPDKPGGLAPEVHEQIKADEADADLAAAQAADDGKLRDPLDHDGNGEKGGAVDLDSMTVAQLKQHAADHEIDLEGATTKADIRAAIDKAQAE